MTTQELHTLEEIELHLKDVEEKFADDVGKLETVSKTMKSRSRLQIRNPDDDAIKGGTLRITWISGIIAALVALGSTWGSLWDAVYGQDPSMWVKTAVLMTIIAAWSLIAAADILGRAFTKK
jgi:hypothetical protein